MTSTLLIFSSACQSISAGLRNRVFCRLATVQPTGSTSRVIQRTSPIERSMASKRGSKGKWTKPTRPQVKRTHFICLPLATEASIPQLKESLAKFRQITSPTEDVVSGSVGRSPGEHPRGSSSSRQQHIQDENHNSATDVPKQSSTSLAQDLCQIPIGAHRPPGTLHLTLGVMDLSEQADMERALQLLEDINYVDLLRQAEAMVSQHQLDRENEKEALPLADKIPDKAGMLNRAANTIGVDAEARVVPTSTKAPLESLNRAISPPSFPASVFSKSNDTLALNQTSSFTPHDKLGNQALPEPFSLTLQGLGTFPSARSSRVFFAHVRDTSHRLQTFAELVRQRFMDVGLVTETRPLVLHATVANLIYVKGRKGRSSGSRGNDSGGRTGEVDAREILKFFNSEDGESILCQQQPPVSNDDHATTPLQSTRASTSTSSHLPSSSTSLDDGSASTDTGHRNQPRGHVWARDVRLDRIRICKMGAEPCDIPDWGMEYKPIGERIFCVVEPQSRISTL